MTDPHLLVYVEIDVDVCTLTYGVAPCTAALGTTGDRKCFNSFATCQDAEHYDPAPVTLRFAKPAVFLPRDIRAIPSITDVQVTEAQVSLGEDLGDRAVMTVTFADHPWPDTGPGGDKYLTDRDYDPVKRGSFFGKLRARQTNLRGKPARLRVGRVGQTLDQMETRHFIVDSIDGPDASGRFNLVAPDVLQFANDKRSVAPRPNSGFLQAAIDVDDSSATLAPSGIGDIEYPASGHINLGGKEIVSFTRSGDALTLTGRGQLGTVASDHDAEDRAQIVLRYEGEDPADIIADLLTAYTPMPADYIPIDDWRVETAAYLGQVYTRTIPEPTGVSELISDLIEQAGLAVWQDDVALRIHLQVLRSINTTAALFGEKNRMVGSLSIAEQPAKRITQVLVYYGLVNPLESATGVDNYRGRHLEINSDSELAYGGSIVKTIFATWIPAFGLTIAQRLALKLLGRFAVPPRWFEFDLFRNDIDSAALGGGYRLTHFALQDDTGGPDVVPIQVLSLSPQPDRLHIAAEEARFVNLDPTDLRDRQIIIPTNVYDVDLLDIHNSLYPDLTDADVADGVNLTVTVQPGVIIGATSTSIPAFFVSSGWPSGFPITIVNHGRMQGAGGGGGDANNGVAGSPGGAGGSALHSDFPLDLTNDDGEIYGGAGGGGGGGGQDAGGSTKNAGNPGGGGAGSIGGGPGSSDKPNTQPDYQPAESGTSEVGGNSGQKEGNSTTAGDGGAPGVVGFAGANWAGGTGAKLGGAGGAAGPAIDGYSLVTLTGADGDIRGARIN